MINVTYSRIKMEADAVLENGLELQKKVSTVSNRFQMDRRAKLNIFQASLLPTNIEPFPVRWHEREGWIS